MIIREMNSLDIEKVRAIAKDTWKATYSSFIPKDIQNKVLEEAYSNDEMTNRFNSSINLVAEDNEELMEYAFLSSKETDYSLFLESIYIHPNFQGKGVGKKLLYTGISKFPKATNISLTVYKGNPNLSFYEKEGFKVIKEIDGNFFQHPVTFILMKKEMHNLNQL